MSACCCHPRSSPTAPGDSSPGIGRRAAARGVVGDDAEPVRPAIHVICGPVSDQVEMPVVGQPELVDRPGGFVMPHPAAREPAVRHTPTGRAEFIVSPVELLQVGPCQLVLQTLRSHDQFNTTIYGMNDRYCGILSGRRVVFVNADDTNCSRHPRDVGPDDAVVVAHALPVDPAPTVQSAFRDAGDDGDLRAQVLTGRRQGPRGVDDAGRVPRPTRTPPRRPGRLSRSDRGWAGSAQSRRRPGANG